MESALRGFTRWITFPLVAMLVAFSCLGLSGNSVMAQEKYAKMSVEQPDLKNFDNSTNIDNEWMPFKPGTRFLYSGTTVEDGETHSHRVEITVTDLTKMIGGVRAVVTWDLDYDDGELVEAELAFFAQDKEGNVWRMGEYPEEYEDGKIIGAPTWIHGVEDAKAGIMMKAKPRLGTPSYSQGWGPAVKFSDRGEVYQMGQKTKVPFGSYEDVLVIKEFSSNEPDAYQLKYYARGVGEVRVGWQGEGDKLQEFLELVEVKQLDPKELAQAREAALKLEKSAYENSRNVYAHTPPLEHSLVGSTGSTALKIHEPTAAIQPAAMVTGKAPKITQEEAIKIALKAVPGDVTDVKIENKLGANRYVVEVIAKEDGAETDVIIDMGTGKVLGTEK